MNKLFIAIISISIAATSACSVIDRTMKTVKAEKATEQKPKTEKRAIRKAVVGDSVVARMGPGNWIEGRVRSLNSNGSEASIEWADGSSPSDVDTDAIFALPKAGDELNLQTGDFALVHSSTDNWWNAAEISEVGKTVIKAKLIYSGEVVNLSREKVIEVNDTVAADIKDAADKEDFLNRAHEHSPVRMSGYIPKVGDHILGAWTTNAWYGGRVKSVKGDVATIIWEGGMKPDDASLQKIVRYPSASDGGPVPSVGDFVLVKPANGNLKAAWVYAQVTAVDGTTIEAKDIDETRDYPAGDYIRLER
jgi:hypothetical protein